MKRSGHVKGCPVCGKDNAVNVTVRIQRLTGQGRVDGTARFGRHVASKSKSFCAKHGERAFAEVSTRLLDAAAESA